MSVGSKTRWKAASAVLSTAAIGMFLYQIVFVVFEPRGIVELQTYHLAFAFTVLYAGEILKVSRTWQRVCLLMLGLASLAACAYILVFQDALELRSGFPTEADVYVGLFFIFTIFFCTWRRWGFAIPIVVGIGIAYALWGQHLPANMAAPRSEWKAVVDYLTVGLSGMIGPLLNNSVYYIFFFVVFGGLLIANYSAPGMVITFVWIVAVFALVGGVGHIIQAFQQRSV